MQFYISSIISTSLNRFKNFSENRYWEVYAVLLCILYIFITSFPSYYDLTEPEVILYQGNHFLQPLPGKFLDDSHFQKHQFRLFVPFLVWLLKLNTTMLLILQYLSAAGLLWLSCRLASAVTGEKVAGLLSVIYVSSLFAGKTGFYDVFWHFDCVAIALILLAKYSNNVVIIFLSVFCSAFTDERGLISSSLLLCYFLIQSRMEGRSLFSMNRKAVALLAAWCFYFAARFWLVKANGFSTGTDKVGLHVLVSNYNILPTSFLFTFEAGWVLILAAMLMLWKKNRFLTAAFSGSFMLIFLVALMVLDVSRSTSYMLPGWFCGLYICSREPGSKSWFLPLMFLCTLFSAIIPTQEFYLNQVYWLGPIFPKILKFL